MDRVTSPPEVIRLDQVTCQDGELAVLLSSGQRAVVRLHPEGRPDSAPAERVIERLHALAQMLENHLKSSRAAA